MIYTLASLIVPHAETSFKMAPTICQKYGKQFFFFFFVKKLHILCSSDHPILFRFRQLVVNIDRNYKSEIPLVP